MILHTQAAHANTGGVLTTRVVLIAAAVALCPGGAFGGGHSKIVFSNDELFGPHTESSAALAAPPPPSTSTSTAVYDTTFAGKFDYPDAGGFDDLTYGAHSHHSRLFHDPSHHIFGGLPVSHHPHDLLASSYRTSPFSLHSHQVLDHGYPQVHDVADHHHHHHQHQHHPHPQQQQHHRRYGFGHGHHFDYDGIIDHDNFVGFAGHSGHGDDHEPGLFAPAINKPFERARTLTGRYYMPELAYKRFESGSNYHDADDDGHGGAVDHGHEGHGREGVHVQNSNTPLRPKALKIIGAVFPVGVPVSLGSGHFNGAGSTTFKFAY